MRIPDLRPSTENKPSVFARETRGPLGTKGEKRPPILVEPRRTLGAIFTANMTMNTILKSLVILTVSGIASSVAAADKPASETLGLWEKNCASCHAKDGSGDTKMGKKLSVKDYRDARVQSELENDKALKAVKEGLKEKGEQRMKAFAEKLSDAEIKDLIAHMRTFKK